MNRNPKLDSEGLQSELQAISSSTQALAAVWEGNTLALLAILRTLESLHRDIRDGVFQRSLPDNRKDLYHLLRDIEEEGGWPYIDRMKLHQLLAHLEEINAAPEPLNAASQDPAASS